MTCCIDNKTESNRPSLFKDEDRPKIGVLGGSFDPIHLGHVSLGINAVIEANLSKLIVMPTHIQPFKKDNNVTDDIHRLNMARLAFEDYSFAYVSDYEIKKNEISYTVDTLNYLASKYVDEEIFFITGTDSFMEIDKWYKGIELLSKFSFIVSLRPGYDKEKLDEKSREYNIRYGTKVICLKSQMPDISSTEIRNIIMDGKDASNLIPEKVKGYINSYGLYKRD